MTGLEKILKAIEDDAKANAQEIISQANKEAETVLSAAQAEADKKCAEIAAKSEADVKAAISRAESAAALQEKKTILNAKQQLINDTLVKARNSIAGLPDVQYADMLLKIVKKFAHNKTGIMKLSAADIKRLPSDFNTKLKAVLKEKSGAALTVSDEPADIDGGFLLVYGDIEENCSIEALFSAAREELQDKVNAFLFGTISADKDNPLKN